MKNIDLVKKVKDISSQLNKKADNSKVTNLKEQVYNLVL